MHLNNAYFVLHLDGYYGGITSIKTIESGFENATSIINSLKPYQKMELVNNINFLIHRYTADNNFLYSLYCDFFEPEYNSYLLNLQ